MLFRPYFVRPLAIVKTCLFILIFHMASAQVSVRGKVLDEGNKPLAFVVVSLRQGSSIVGNEITDSTGGFGFRNVKKGHCSFLLKLFSYSDTVITAAIGSD